MVVNDYGIHAFTRSSGHSRARVRIVTLACTWRRIMRSMSTAPFACVVVASRATRAGWREGTRSFAASTSPRASAGARASTSTSTSTMDDAANDDGTTVPESSNNVALYAVQRGDTLFSIATEHGCETEQLVGENELGVRRSIEVGQILRVPVNVERASYTVRAKLTNAPLGNTPASSGRRKTSTRLGGLAPRAKMATTRRRVGRDHRVVTPAQTVGIGACVAISIVVLSVSANGSRSKQAARRAFKGVAKKATASAESPNVSVETPKRAASRAFKGVPKKATASSESLNVSVETPKPAFPTMAKSASPTYSDDRDAMLVEISSMRELLRSYDFSAEPPNVSDASEESLRERDDDVTLLSYDEGYEAMKATYLAEMETMRASKKGESQEAENAEASFFSIVRESLDDDDDDDEDDDDDDDAECDGATSVVADEKSPETIRAEESSAVVLGAAESKAREYVLANARMVNESAPRPVMDKKLSRSTSIRAASRGSDQGFKRALPMALGSLIYDAQVVVNAIQKRVLG